MKKITSLMMVPIYTTTVVIAFGISHLFNRLLHLLMHVPVGQEMPKEVAYIDYGVFMLSLCGLLALTTVQVWFANQIIKAVRSNQQIKNDD